jgi:hypothetical protein
VPGLQANLLPLPFVLGSGRPYLAYHEIPDSLFLGGDDRGNYLGEARVALVDIGPVILEGFPEGRAITALTGLIPGGCAADKVAVIGSGRGKGNYLLAVKIEETYPDLHQGKKIPEQILHSGFIPNDIHNHPLYKAVS